MKLLAACAFVSSFIGTLCLAHAQAPAPVPGYILVTGWYKDAGVQREYTRAVAPILKAHGYETSAVGIDGAGLKVIEGDWIPGKMALLIKFQSEKDAKSFWWSKEYQQAKKIRAGASALDVVQLDGVAGAAPIMNEKSAYLIFIGDVQDRATFVRDYAPKAPDVVKQYGGQFLVRAGLAETELLEGQHPPGSIIVVEFPTADAMMQFWNSDAYRRLSEIRKSTGKWSVAAITPQSSPSR